MAPSLHLLVSVLVSVAISTCECAKTLVIADNLDIQYTHSLFFQDLKQSGVDLEFIKARDSNLRLQSYGQWLYDNIILFAGAKTRFGGAVDVQYLLDFVDSGRNFLIASDEGVSDPVRELASQTGADFMDQSSLVVDHISYSRNHGPEHVLAYPPNSSSDVPGKQGNPLRYRGVGVTTASESLTSFALGSAPPTAQSIKAGRASKTSGSRLGLAVGIQALNNARVVVTGSTAMFSDAFYTELVIRSDKGDETRTTNRAICKDLALWVLQLKGVLRMTNFRHHRTAEPVPPPFNTYTVNDEIVVKVDVHELHSGEWVPHHSDSIMLQYVMLDPYIRQKLHHDGQGHYSLTVKAPDVYGVFKWVIDYKNRGYNSIHLEEVAPVRPYRHDEFARFVVQAYPYYASILSLSIGFFVMITLVVFHKDKPAAKAGKSP